MHLFLLTPSDINLLPTVGKLLAGCGSSSESIHYRGNVPFCTTVKVLLRLLGPTGGERPSQLSNVQGERGHELPYRRDLPRG